MPDEWNGWRGLEKQAAADSGKYPVEWNQTDHVLWKVNIRGEGHSSPVVNDKYVVITAAELNTSGTTLKDSAVRILTLLSLILILYSAYSFLKKQKRIVKSGDFLYNISFSGILGLLLFSFAIMYWMYFGESTLHKSLLNYFFSGAVVLFCILLTAIQTSKTSILRIFICVLVIALSLLLFDNRPSPDYFLTSIFFDPTGIWLMPASFCGFFIPVSISIYLIAVTFYRKQDKARVACRDVHEFTSTSAIIQGSRPLWRALLTSG